MLVGVGSLEKAAEEPPHHSAQGHTQDDGHGDVDKVHELGVATLGHAGKGGKEDDDKDIITGGPGQNHLGDALLGAVPRLHQLHHPGHHHRRGHRPQHGAHDGGLHDVDPQQVGGHQHIAQNLKAGGDKGHHHRRTAHLFQVGQVERQARFQQDDDKGHLAQFRRDGQNGRVQPIEHIGAHHNAGDEHTDDAGQLELLDDGRHG